MIEYIRNNQLDIMLFFSGACAVLIPLTWVTTTLSCKRKWMLTLIELSSALLLIFDRFAYIYRGDPSNLGYWMVRISNFFVFSMQVFELEALNIYLSDLFRCEGKLKRTPKLLSVNNYFFIAAMLLLIISQFTGLYYTFCIIRMTCICRSTNFWKNIRTGIIWPMPTGLLKRCCSPRQLPN